MEALAPFTRPAVVAVVAAAFGAALGVLPALLVRRLVDHALPSGSDGAVAVLAAVMVVAAAGVAFATVAGRYAATVVAQRVAADLRTRVYESVRRQSVAFFGDTRAADLSGMLTGGVDGAVEGIETASSHLSAAFTVIATLIAMAMISVPLTIVSVAIVPLLILPVRRLERIRSEAAERKRERLAGISALSGEALGASGAALAKTFGRDDHETRRFAERSRAVRDTAIADALAGRWPTVARHAAATLAPAAIWLLGGRRVIDGGLTLGTVIAITMLQARLPAPVDRLLSVRTDALAALARFERIFEHLDLVPDVRERPGAMTLTNVQGRITFEEVTMKGRGDGMLRELSFEVPSRRLLAIVGTAGAGTGLIAPLATRLNDPDAGAVLLDGHDLRDLSLETISDAVGVIAREPFLFHATVRENILYGRPDAPEAYVAEAAKAARVHDFILTLPSGYETVVGE
ncbi:MAG: ABC transporter transmembrane domain-containing protein, partial [Vicinamibacteria bacterium]